MISILEYVADINARLAAVPTSSKVGEAEEARHRARRRYVWRLDRDEFEQAEGRGRPDEGKQIKTRVATFVVTIEGKTFEETEMLRSALVSATGAVMGGHSNRNYRLGPALWASKADNQDADVCVQELSLVVPFYAADLPSGAPLQDATDNRFTTALITARSIESAEHVETPPP